MKSKNINVSKNEISKDEISRSLNTPKLALLSKSVKSTNIDISKLNEIEKFNKEQLDTINKFIKLYNSNYKGDLKEFVKKPIHYKYINKNEELDLNHIFNTIDYNEDGYMFDPFYKFYKNSDEYMMFLTSYEIKYGKCIFIISNNELNKMSDDNKNKYYPYYLHLKLMFECTEVYKHIEFDEYLKLNDEDKNIKYILLCPYLYLINSIKLDKLKNIIISQDIPYSNIKMFDDFIFELWNSMMNNGNNNENENENEDDEE